MYDNTSTRAAYVRAGALVPPPPCLGGGITRVGPSQYPQYTRAWHAREAVGSSLHRDHRTTATRLTTSPTHSTRLASRAWWRSACRSTEPHPKIVPGPQKSAPQSRRERVAHFEEHPDFKFDCNSKRAVVSAFKNPDSWLKSLCVRGWQLELCDGVNAMRSLFPCRGSRRRWWNELRSAADSYR